MDAYPAVKLLDTGEERLWNGPFFAPAAGTLDGWLLDHWYTGTAQYDALFMQNFSSASEVGLHTLSDLESSSRSCEATQCFRCTCQLKISLQNCTNILVLLSFAYLEKLALLNAAHLQGRCG